MSPILLFIVAARFALPIPTFEPVPSPTAIATYQPPPADATPEVFVGEVYSIMATVERGLRDLPADLRNPGLPLLNSENGFRLFSYAKWMTASSTSDEIFSPYFAGIARRFPVLLYMAIIFGSINLIITVAVFLIRAVVWILDKIRSALPF